MTLKNMNQYLKSSLCMALAISAFAVSGCSTAGGDSAGRTRDFTTTAATTAAGGYIGANNSNYKAKGAAIGAAAGFVVGETINYFNNKAQKEAFLAGYEKGQSNAVKQQYWIARDNQRPRTDDGYEETLYEITVPPSERDGVRREATKRVIRVVMPKEETGS
ncbi:MAG: YMGG-like glycine zipper-containing protein [Nibricoccus sp.]